MLYKKANVENLKNCNKYNIKLVKNTNSLTRKYYYLLEGDLLSQQKVAKRHFSELSFESAIVNLQLF